MAGSRIRNSLEMIPDQGELKNTQPCIPHEGNPLVLMRRPSIFNLETVPSLNGGGATLPVPAWLRQKVVGNNEDRTMRNAPVLPLSHNKPVRVCKYGNFMGVSFFDNIFVAVSELNYENTSERTEIGTLA